MFEHRISESNIRPMAEADIEKVVELIAIARPQDISPAIVFHHMFGYIPTNEIERVIVSKAGNREQWVYDIDGIPVGTIGLYRPTKDTDVKTIWINYYFVHPKYQRHGIGSMLLQFAIEKAIEKNKDTLLMYNKVSTTLGESISRRAIDTFGFSIFFMRKNPERAEDVDVEREKKYDFCYRKWLNNKRGRDGDVLL